MLGVNNNIKNIRFKSFRAIDDLTSCQQFADGHRHVLEIFGITQITSAKGDWMYNPDVYVMGVYDDDTGKMLGGGRIHRANRKNQLPIETAIGYMDENVHKMVDEYTDAGTGEVAGVWNSYEIAGLGVGSIVLSQACVAFSTYIGLTTLFGLAAPATYRNVIKGGFEVVTGLGLNGKFYYPKDDMVATAMFNYNITDLPKSTEPQKSEMLHMRNEILSTKKVLSKEGNEITLIFDLKNKG